MKGLRRAACTAVAALLVASCAGGGRQQATDGPRTVDPAGSPDRQAAAAPATTVGAVTIDVAGVRRLSADLVQFDLTVVNAGQAVVDLEQLVSGPAGGLGQAAFTAASGDSRTFVLRDENGKAQCSDDLGSLAPGARRSIFLRFAAFSALEFTGTLEVPGLAPFAGVTVPAAAAARTAPCPDHRCPPVGRSGYAGCPGGEPWPRSARL